MRSYLINPKSKMGGRGVSSQQVVFELKQRIVMSLNKLADRDTNHIGVEELEKIVHGLGPEGISPFVSCIVDTDSEQKGAVRKECVRIMGVMARCHGGLMASHLGKMMASVVKRLKDTDSVVKDACVETVGVLALSVVGSGADSEGGGMFVVLTKPLFEALGEQNRYVQGGAALCLSRAIDDTKHPPVQILQQMLSRVIKLLKNPHFMAKPALVELVRSIIEAGGATTEHALSAAMSSILDTLKSSDWTARKAASVALTSIAMSSMSLVGSFKPACIRSLEGCRFDKVKPVRDAVLHALKCWKTLSGIASSDISEAESCTKEDRSRAYKSDATSGTDGGCSDTLSGKVCQISTISTKSSSSKGSRAPLATRKTCSNNGQGIEQPKVHDWHVEISLPKACTSSLTHTQTMESEGSCMTKTSETRSNVTQGNAISYQDGEDDDKPECSSVSDPSGGSCETKHVTATYDCPVLVSSRNCVSTGDEKLASECQNYVLSANEPMSPSSGVHKFNSGGTKDRCLHVADELALIKKQLSEIESRQSSLLDLVQVFMGNSMDSLSHLQSKVHGLESAMDKITQNLLQAGSTPIASSSKISKRIPSISSPRLSNCTPRSSVDMNVKQPSRLSLRGSDCWEETASSKSRSSCSVQETAELWRDPKPNTTLDPTSVVIQNNLVRGTKNLGINHTRTKELASSTCYSNSKSSTSDNKNCFWKRIKDFICARDIEGAYLEALLTGDDVVLIELMNRTGPVLERLSSETANEIMCNLASQILDPRFIGLIIPWLEQVVDLSTIHKPNYLCLATKVKRELLLAVQEAKTIDFSSPVESEAIAQLELKLRRLWCEENVRTR